MGDRQETGLAGLAGTGAYKMRFGKLSIHCANCGKLIDYYSAWRSGLGEVKVCGKECHDEFDLNYARSILGKDEERKGLEPPPQNPK
jgi:hypothetical protein